MTRAEPNADPVTLEVIRYALGSISDEMSVTLALSAFSVNIKTRLDMTCALFDRECRLISTSDKICQPGFLGVLNTYAKRVRDAYGVPRLLRGDILVVNDPFLWGTHLPDICLLAPIFDDDHIEPIAYVMCIGHHSDVGGSAPGGYVGNTTDIYQEGLVIPPIRLVREGEIDPEIMELILANVRTKRDNVGDFNAQIACLRIGEARYLELVQRHGTDALAKFSDQILDQTAARFAKLLDALPAGTYHGEDWLDDDGSGNGPIRVAVDLTFGGGKVVVDLSSCDGQVRGPFNCTPGQAASKAFYAIKAMVDPDGEVNDGAYRLIEMIAPEGLVVNPRRPAAVAMGSETSNRVMDATFLALAKAAPHLAIAQCKRTVAVSGYGGIDESTHEPFAFFEAIGGGYGGRSTKDGIDGIQPHTQNTADAEVEELEAAFPVTVDRFEFVSDSEGAGRNRGGLGLRKVLRFHTEITWSFPSDGRRFYPQGIHGGGEACGLRYVYDYGAPDAEIMADTGMRRVPKGVPVAIETPGGGGYGPAFDRPVEKVLADVQSGRISLERARIAYGVAIRSTIGDEGDPSSLTVNPDATAQLREGVS